MVVTVGIEMEETVAVVRSFSGEAATEGSRIAPAREAREYELSIAEGGRNAGWKMIRAGRARVSKLRGDIVKFPGVLIVERQRAEL